MHLLLYPLLLLLLLLLVLLGRAAGLMLRFGRLGKKGPQSNLPASRTDDDAFFKECMFRKKLPLPVREFLLTLKSEKDAAVAERNAAVAEKNLVEAIKKYEVLELEKSIEQLMDSTSALNPRAVLEYVEVKHMPPEYARLSRQVKWARFLNETDIGTNLFNCLKKFPDWESEKKIATHLSNVYSLASQFAHCTSFSIGANPKVPIRISGPLLPQTLQAMNCIGKSFNLQFEDGAAAARGQADPQDAAGEFQG